MHISDFTCRYSILAWLLILVVYLCFLGLCFHISETRRLITRENSLLHVLGRVLVPVEENSPLNDEISGVFSSKIGSVDWFQHWIQAKVLQARAKSHHEAQIIHRPVIHMKSILFFFFSILIPILVRHQNSHTGLPSSFMAYYALQTV
jgi:hypothetical protein